MLQWQVNFIHRRLRDMMNKKPFPIQEVSEIAEKESWRKEINRPIYHIHKWWAQRLGSVFRAILLQLMADNDVDTWDAFYKIHNFSDVTVLDPFMGSGTTIGEALKLGAKAVGCDINPISSFLVRQEFTHVPYQELLDTYKMLECKVASKIRDCYRTLDIESGSDIPVLYYFWVKIVETPEGEEIPLFSRYVFAQNAYPSKKPDAQILCPDCWGIFKGKYNQEISVCPHCGHTFNPQIGPVHNGIVTTKDGKNYKIKDLIPRNGKLLGEKMYALLAVNTKGEKIYQSIQKYDITLFEQIEKKIEVVNCLLPTYEVKSGYNTDQARGYNYFHWKDFFNTRQLFCLGLLLSEIIQIPNQKIKEQFLCLFSSTLEFNNTFCSYKGEGTGAVRPIFSNHILKPERTPLENSVWGHEKSSGCFSSLFKSRLLTAKRYLNKPFELKIDRKIARSQKIIASSNLNPKITVVWEDFVAQKNAVLILNGDSANLPIPNDSIDFIVTDPPYFDFIHYSELSDFFYAWLSPILKERYVFFETDTSRRENEVQQTNAKEFSKLLGNVFAEGRRVLKADGQMVFSFHHSRLDGWSAISNAIKHADFFVVDVFPIHAELMASTPKAGAKEPISIDAIIICAKKCIIFSKEDIVSESIRYIDELKKSKKYLSKSDIFVITISQSLKKCVNERLSEIDTILTMEETFKQVTDRLAEGKF